ncbi:MAG: tetratricopeptide repeat protein [Candidatus Hydrogenedentes bacterium]|nr:tetratricopeptide repeat protein [Candidatus Hydrogenedentota bacterium]
MSGSRPPRLSVSVIVRNEARRLPGFLSALDGLDCELVLADTGSSDDTAAIARARGVVVHEIPWGDDFAAARNAAMDRCSGLWILSLDADERFGSADLAALGGLASGPPDCAYRFTTRNYTSSTSASGFVPVRPGDPASGGYPGWFPSAKVRLFPNQPGVCFEGVVHELVEPSLGRLNIPVRESGIAVLHYPERDRSAEEQAAKQRRYLELGLKKLAAAPGNPKCHKELGDQYLDLGDLAAALTSYREAVRLDPENPIWLRDLGAALLVGGRVPQAIQALRLSIARDPAPAEVWRNLGIALAQQEDWPGAREAFAAAAAREPEHPETRRYLAIALNATGAREAALAELDYVLERYPGHAEALALRARILEAPGGNA